MAKVSRNVANAASDLMVALGRLRRRLRDESPRSGISLAQVMALSRLVRDGPCAPGVLAAAEHVRAQSMGMTVARLHALGLVERSDDPEDGRRVIVMATERGRDLVVSIRKSRNAWLARAIATCLSAEEYEVLSKALPLLERLAECDPERDESASGASSYRR